MQPGAVKPWTQQLRSHPNIVVLKAARSLSTDINDVIDVGPSEDDADEDEDDDEDDGGGSNGGGEGVL